MRFGFSHKTQNQNPVAVFVILLFVPAHSDGTEHPPRALGQLEKDFLICQTGPDKAEGVPNMK